MAPEVTVSCDSCGAEQHRTAGYTDSNVILHANEVQSSLTSEMTLTMRKVVIGQTEAEVCLICASTLLAIVHKGNQPVDPFGHTKEQP